MKLHQMQEEKNIVEEFADKIAKENRKAILTKWAPFVVLLALFVFFSIVCGSSFTSTGNIKALLNQVAIPLIVATGLTFVIVIGSIDLSIDGTVGMAASLVAFFALNNKTSFDFGIFAAMIAILICVAVGILIGFIHVNFKVPSFMVSFAFLYMAKGFGMLTYKGIPATIMDPLFTSIPGMTFLRLPLITWISIAVFLFALFLERRTALGRHMYGIGTNESIPISLGINVKAEKMKIFAFAGLCFGIAGVIGACRLGRGQINIGEGLMFPAQAAVIVGGTSLSGGKGGMMNTLVGVGIMTVLENGLTLLGVNPYIRSAVQGVIILVAVILTVSRGSKVVTK